MKEYQEEILGIIQRDTFNELRLLNTKRAERWHAGGEPWTGADWSNAMCGEAGETANAVKKMRRLETGVDNKVPGRQSLTKDEVRTMIAKEIGDTVIYLDLLAAHYEIDLGETVCKVFNQISEREGFPERLSYE